MSRVPLTLKLLLMLAVVGLMLNFFMIWTVGSNTMDSNQKRQSLNSPPLVSAETNSKPVVWINAKKELAMSHVHTVFDRLGYRLRLPGEAWDVMWSHGYPFNIFKEDLQNLHPHQRVNHFPGTSCFVSKPKLSTHGFSFTPKTYRLPEDVDQLLTQAKKYPEKLWIQKSNKHRGIRIIKPEAIELKYKDSIVQEYVEKPMLIDGRKFDVGIYVAIMSVNPLRVYAYGEEILWRFCPKPYHPFDENDKERYVIDDEYAPAWEIPMVRPLVQDSGLSHKEAFNYILKQKGFAPEKFWNTAHSIIQQVMYHCESAVVNYTKSYASINNFVEMVRFDFVTDENLNIWLMEVNLSPNLSSSHVTNNRFMYEQLVFNFLSITGLARGPDQGLRYNGEYESIMFANEHDTQVPLLHCIDGSCANNCKHQLSCKLCKQCQNDKFIFTLKTAFLEHVNKRNFHRLIPPPRDGCHGKMLPPGTISRSHHSTRVNNYLMEEWFDGKCCQNQNWCS